MKRVKNTPAQGGEVHVMPNDDRHVPMRACWCGPVEDEQTKRLIAQGFPSERVWIHQKAN